MTAGENRNVYLDQVVAQQERLEQDLRSKRVASSPAPAAGAPGRRQAPAVPASSGAGSAAVDVRITGFWRWKTVLVP